MVVVLALGNRAIARRVVGGAMGAAVVVDLGVRDWWRVAGQLHGPDAGGWALIVFNHGVSPAAKIWG